MCECFRTLALCFTVSASISMQQGTTGCSWLVLQEPLKALVRVGHRKGCATMAWPPSHWRLLTQLAISCCGICSWACCTCAPDWLLARHLLLAGSEPCLLQNMKAVAKINDIAKAKGVTAGQMALAWVHSRGDDVIPIPGKTRGG